MDFDIDVVDSPNMILGIASTGLVIGVAMRSLPIFISSAILFGIGWRLLMRAVEDMRSEISHTE